MRHLFPNYKNAEIQIPYKGHNYNVRAYII